MTTYIKTKITKKTQRFPRNRPMTRPIDNFADVPCDRTTMRWRRLKGHARHTLIQLIHASTTDVRWRRWRRSKSTTSDWRTRRRWSKPGAADPWSGRRWGWRKSTTTAWRGRWRRRSKPAVVGWRRRWKAHVACFMYRMTLTTALERDMTACYQERDSV